MAAGDHPEGRPAVPDDHHARILQARARRDAARRARDEADSSYYQVIKEALEAGLKPALVASFAGESRQRIGQIRDFPPGYPAREERDGGLPAA